VENGQTAIAYLDGAGKFADRAAYPLPGLVLLDIKLPGLHGFDVLAWVRQDKRFAHLPVAMLSSSDEPGDIHKARQLGANCYIVKQSGYLDVVQFLGALRSGGGAA
jgi:CheY-like chemotaxis protein